MSKYSVECCECGWTNDYSWQNDIPDICPDCGEMIPDIDDDDDECEEAV